MTKAIARSGRLEVARSPEAVRLAGDRVIAKLREAEALLESATTICQAKIVADVAAAQKVFAQRQQLGDHVTAYAHEIQTYALAKLGKLLGDVEKSVGGDRKGRRSKLGALRRSTPNAAATLSELLELPKKKAQNLAHFAKNLAGLPKGLRDAIAKRELTYARVIREQRRKRARERLETLAAREVQAPTGQFDVLVIDPPWPMEKIERDVRPNQVEFDYPRLSEEELAALELPLADDCHVWLWATQRFLPMAFRLLEAWDLTYVCTFVWHKPGGFQPIGLPQFNCEFALYARHGAPMFLDTKAFPVCFDAPRGDHSEKPEAFYELVRRVTAGRRLDMYNRRPIRGFTGWGHEAA